MKKKKIKNLFINYFPYTEIDKLNNYNSEYWKEMTKNKDHMQNTLWFNIYSMNKKFSYRNFIKYQTSINKNNNYFIYSLEQLLTPKSLIKILIVWLKTAVHLF